VENRAQKYHRERMAELLREEIETIIEGELADPRIGLANVTELLLANDGRSARVMIAVEGSEQDAVETREGLLAAVGYIRHELIERLHLRRCPELHFQIDKSHSYEARVDELLGRTKKRSATKPSEPKPNAEKSGT
jgi:ribosome-binding factor A